MATRRPQPTQLSFLDAIPHEQHEPTRPPAARPAKERKPLRYRAPEARMRRIAELLVKAMVAEKREH